MTTAVFKLGGISSKKPQYRHKPSRMVRLPEAIAASLEQIAAEEFTTLTVQVIAACREYLTRRDRLPAPSDRKPPR